MDNKQFTSNDSNQSPHSNQCFLADRFTKKSNYLNIPDTIPENLSAESSGDSLKMEANNVATGNISDENISLGEKVKCNESLIKRKLEFSNDTISTPPSLLRKEISLLRNEMAEAHEFHDFEIQVLKEEKLNEVDSHNYLELLEKYSSLMELYTTLKAEYDEYRQEQEKMRQELHSKTANCLESLCSQIETSDNSLNFSSASFASFNGGIRSSTMMEDISEVEATVLNDATILAKDPLSLSSDGMFKTPMQTPLKSAKKLFRQELNSTTGKPIVKEVEEIISERENKTSIGSEYNIQLLNLETAFYDKVKEVEDLEQRLFKVEDLSSVLQNEFERITSIYAKENTALKESLSKKTEQLNEVMQKLFTETISLNPSLRDSLTDISGIKLLIIFIETIMESCKQIQNEKVSKHNAEKAAWEEERKTELTTIENLQNQISSQQFELDDMNRKCETLEQNLSDAKNTILNGNEEIRMLQARISSIKQTEEDFASAREAVSELESRLTLTEAEKIAAENRYRELETMVENIKLEIGENKELQLELRAQLLSAEEKKSEIEKENAYLKQSHDFIKERMTEVENELKTNILKNKEKLEASEETLSQLKSQLQSTQTERTKLENQCSELQESNESLRIELTNAKNVENNPEYNKIQFENNDLKQRIFESEKIMAELKAELEIAKEDQMNNFCKAEELKKEVEELKKENSTFSRALDAIEESQKIVADTLLDFQSDSDSPSDRITKLIESSSKPKDLTEKRETKIISAFAEIITKTCKEVQNELIKQFDNKKLEWELQRNDDLKLITNLQDQIKNFTEKIVQDEAQILEINVANENLLKLQENYKTQILEAEQNISAHIVSLKQTKDDLLAANETISELKLQLESALTENIEVKDRCRVLEETLTSLQNEVKLNEFIIKDLDELKIVREKFEHENGDLRQQILKSEELVIHLKNSLEKSEEERSAGEVKIQDLQNEINVLKKGLEDLMTLSEKLGHLEKNNKNLVDILSDVQFNLKLPENTLEDLMSDNFENKKIFSERINSLIKIQAEGQNEELKKLCETLEKKLSNAEKTILAREEEILIVQSNMQKTREDFTSAVKRLSNLESRLTLSESEKKESENQCGALNSTRELERESDIRENVQEEPSSPKIDVEIENIEMKKSSDAIKGPTVEAGNGIFMQDDEIRALKSLELEIIDIKDKLTLADETILHLKSQLKSVEVEKSEMENMCSELRERNQNLHEEINLAKNLENNPAYEKIQNENDDLKQRILESEKLMSELKNELELAKDNQMSNICKVEELIREIEELKRENTGIANVLTTIEETQKNLADVLSDDGNDSELPSDRITKLMGQNSKLPDSVDPRETKFVADFVETITKTCKGVQNELIKKFDSRKLEWENQKDVDLKKLQDQILLLTERNIEHEALIKQTKDDLAEADKAIKQLKSQLSLAQTEKIEMEIRCRKLENDTLSLHTEIETKEMIIKGLDELKTVREKIENENSDLKQQIVQSEEVITRLKKCLEITKEEQIAKEVKMQDLQNEINLLKAEQESVTILREKLENVEKSNRNLLDLLSNIHSHLNMPEDVLTKLLSGSFENKKIFIEKIDSFAKSQMEGLKAENKNLKLGIDNMKEKVKQLTKLIGETAINEQREEHSNLNSSHPYGMSLRSKSNKSIDICVRRLDKLEEINHNLTELLTRILTMTEFPDLDKLKLCSVRDFPNITKKVVAHFNSLESKMKELKEENAQLDEECETYANIIKDLKKEAAAVWKTNKEKTEAMEAEINRLKEEEKCLENEKQSLLTKISKLESECQKLKTASKTEGVIHSCSCGNESKKINELKRTILVKEQKLLELQDLEAQSVSYKSQIEYLKIALEKEKKKTAEEKEKNKKLQNELNGTSKNQKVDNNKADENQMLDELRMRGSISGGIVQEFVDKEKMRKLSKDIGILKELCRARYAEIKRLEAVNASLRNGTPKNSNQMDSPIRTRGYSVRSKNQVRDFWRTEIVGKENSAL